MFIISSTIKGNVMNLDIERFLQTIETEERNTNRIDREISLHNLYEEDEDAHEYKAKSPIGATSGSS